MRTAVTWFVPAPAAHIPALAAPFGIRLRLPGGGIALTFDDGPHPRGTPAVLEVLARAGVHATFFLTGEQVEPRPSLAAEIAAAGHEIAIHGYRHTLLLRRTPRALAADLDRAAHVIADATAASPRCYRPPYGVFSSAGVAIARSRGWVPLLWSRWGRDWTRRATPEGIAARATRDLSSGDVVLLHDADWYSTAGSWQRTVAALPAILDAVDATGEPLVRVSDAIRRTE